MDRMVEGIDLVVGVDAIRQLGGVLINGDRVDFRAPYRPSGNGIVYRHHSTINVLAERSGIFPQKVVFWYNLSPKTGQTKSGFCASGCNF